MSHIMCRIKFYIYFTIISFSIWLCFHSHLLFAGLNVNPAVVEVVVPKEGISRAIQVGNTGEKPIKVRAEINKTRKGNTYAENWFVILPCEIELKPGETKDFSYVITPPEGAEGELRCMIFFVADEIDEKRSMVGIRFGVPVYAIIKDTVNLKAGVDKILVNYDIQNKSLKGTVYVKNESNIHIRPFVNVDILDKVGDRINSFEIPFGQPVQVNQIRPFMFSHRLEFAPGIYKLNTSVHYGKMYGLKDYVATKEVEFEVRPPEVTLPEEVGGGVEKEKTETESGVSGKIEIGGGK